MGKRVSREGCCARIASGLFAQRRSHDLTMFFLLGVFVELESLRERKSSSWNSLGFLVTLSSGVVYEEICHSVPRNNSLRAMDRNDLIFAERMINESYYNKSAKCKNRQIRCLQFLQWRREKDEERMITGNEVSRS
ncbi:hypothetical protein K0M31_018852 [Melipona bicolor]|uniref:Uncharacterized protein n=1 Tax=Melipona bicolor TaxID=60889 RepID=A0AA40G4W1_9HYME|nr:hypothetical protein K0M31_018852 [Melipona bicolor]